MLQTSETPQTPYSTTCFQLAVYRNDLPPTWNISERNCWTGG